MINPEFINELAKRKGIFITATGTDVGKTYISGLLLKLLRENGHNAGYFKPALSGAYYCKDELIPGDAEYVCKMSKINRNPSELVGYIFEQPVSPHLASELNNCSIDEKIIMQKFNRVKQDYDFMLIEGAGGIVCPLRMGDNPLLLIDIIKTIGLDLIIVVSSGLGTINSTVLTVEYAQTHGVQIYGIIMNAYDENNYMHRDNKISIKKLTGLPILATVSKEVNSI